MFSTALVFLPKPSAVTPVATDRPAPGGEV
jgi:hypothetical protein